MLSLHINCIICCMFSSFSLRSIYITFYLCCKCATIFCARISRNVSGVALRSAFFEKDLWIVFSFKQSVHQFLLVLGDSMSVAVGNGKADGEVFNSVLLIWMRMSEAKAVRCKPGVGGGMGQGQYVQKAVWMASMALTLKRKVLTGIPSEEWATL